MNDTRPATDKRTIVEKHIDEQPQAYAQAWLRLAEESGTPLSDMRMVWSLLARLAAAEAENAKLREALRNLEESARPIANKFGHWYAGAPDDESAGIDITAGQLRQLYRFAITARLLLEAKP